MMSRLREMRIGYVPYSHSLDRPGDRRRFVYYAKKRNLSFEIADPSEKYDVVVVTENADLGVWSEYASGGAKVIFDFIDSYLAIPRSNLKGRLRGFAKFLSGQSKHLRLNYWKSCEALCARADAVVCSTEEQRRDIYPFCKNVHVILDVQSPVVRTHKVDYRVGAVFNLVWEGLPSNVSQLCQLKSVLANLQARRKIVLHLITDLEFNHYLGRYGKSQTVSLTRGLCDNVRLYDWNEQTCSNIICAADLAVIPIDLSDPFARGKPENKLLLFWRMGMPTVTSATPAYDRAMARAGLSTTCRTEAEWVNTLEKCIEDESGRRHHGVIGRAFSESDYGEASILERWDKLFVSIL